MEWSRSDQSSTFKIQVRRHDILRISMVSPFKRKKEAPNDSERQWKGEEFTNSCVLFHPACPQPVHYCLHYVDGWFGPESLNYVAILDNASSACMRPEDPTNSPLCTHANEAKGTFGHNPAYQCCQCRIGRCQQSRSRERTHSTRGVGSAPFRVLGRRI